MSDKLEFGVVGARDFSPEITVHITGTEVPCFGKFPAKFQFIAPQNLWDTCGLQYAPEVTLEAKLIFV